MWLVDRARLEWSRLPLGGDDVERTRDGMCELSPEVPPELPPPEMKRDTPS